MLTSKELSQELKERGFVKESDNKWIAYKKDVHKNFRNYKSPRILNGNILNNDWEELYPAYDILNDLCVRYSKEVWGEKYSYLVHEMLYRWHSKEVLSLLQEGKEKEVEDYIRANSKLFNN